MANSYQNYQNTNISTADKGKLVLMVYDHCIKWLKKAEEEMALDEDAKPMSSLRRAQDGLTELRCSLNMEKGGEISKNLFSLYEFYSWHLTEALRVKSAQFIRDVVEMMSALREAWALAIETIRREDANLLKENTPTQFSMVS